MQIIKKSYPWYHEIATEILSKDDFKALQAFCKKKIPSYMKPHKYSLLPPKEWDSEQINKIALKLSKKIKNYFNSNQINFPEARLFREGYITTIDLNFSPPAPYAYPVHDENIMKSFSFVMYISPEKNTGTHLYLKANSSRPEYTVSWMANSALLFAGVENKTWHSYTSLNNQVRITLNINLIPTFYFANTSLHYESSQNMVFIYREGTPNIFINNKILLNFWE